MSSSDFDFRILREQRIPTVPLELYVRRVVARSAFVAWDIASCEHWWHVLHS